MFKKNRVQTLLLLCIKSFSALYVGTFALQAHRDVYNIKRVQHVYDPQYTIKHLNVGNVVRGNFYENNIILPTIAYIIYS